MISIINGYCQGCSEFNTENCTSDCVFNQLLQKARQIDSRGGSQEQGCHICLDKKGKNKDVFYDNPRGGIGVANFCPNCGRKLEN